MRGFARLPNVSSKNRGESDRDGGTLLHARHFWPSALLETTMAIPLEDRLPHREFAEKARAELEENWQHWRTGDVARWWFKWCQFGKATHDGLGRVLLEVAD